MHEYYIDYDSFVPCVWWSVNHIVCRTLGWSLSTTAKMPCSWLTHMRLPYLLWPLLKQWIMNNKFCIFDKSRFNSCGSKYIQMRVQRCETHTNVILFFGAHADLTLPSAHISTRPAKMWLQLSSCAFSCFVCGTHFARANNMWKHMNQKHIAINCYVISTRVIFFEFVKDSRCDSKRRDRV